MKELFYNKYIKNISWLAFEKFIKTLLGGLVSVFIIRYFGPNEFGILSYANSIVGILFVISKLGFDQILVQKLTENSSQKEVILSSSIFFRLITSFFLFLIYFILVKNFSDSKENIILYILGACIFFSSFNFIDQYFQSQVKNEYIVKANLFASVIITILKFCLILFKQDLETYVKILLFESFLISTFYVFFLVEKGDFDLNKIKIKLNIPIKIFERSWLLLISGVAITIYTKIDQIMIKEMLTNEAVGKYGAAVRLSEFFYFIPVIIINTFFPSLVKNFNNDHFNKRLEYLYFFAIIFSSFLFIFFYFSSDILIYFALGNDFSETPAIFNLYLATVFFVFIGMINNSLLILHKLEKYIFLLTILQANTQQSVN